MHIPYSSRATTMLLVGWLAFCTVPRASSIGSGQRPSLLRDIRTSSDVAWLERIAGELSVAEDLHRRTRDGYDVKDLRASAFIRLGVLESADSLAAIRRIEARHRGQSTIPRPLIEGRVIYHPASHMGNSGPWRPEHTVFDGDRRYVVFVGRWYRSRAVFIAWWENGAWTRPLLTNVLLPPDAHPTVQSITVVSAGHLRVTFGREPWRKEGDPQPPDTIKLAEVTLDTDGDGWSDLEERELGLNPSSKDSDGDDIPDDTDATPTYRAQRAEDDTTQLLDAAIFSAFGLTHSPLPLFVDAESTRVQLSGMPSPVIYTEATRHGPVGAVFVTWKIVERSDIDAVVETTDYEGPLAASGEHHRLKRIGGRWYAVDRKMLWVS